MPMRYKVIHEKHFHEKKRMLTPPREEVFTKKMSVQFLWWSLFPWKLLFSDFTKNSLFSTLRRLRLRKNSTLRITIWMKPPKFNSYLQTKKPIMINQGTFWGKKLNKHIKMYSNVTFVEKFLGSCLKNPRKDFFRETKEECKRFHEKYWLNT